MTDEYTVRNITGKGDNVVDAAAKTPDGAIKEVFGVSWRNWFGVTEVYDSADVPPAEDHRKRDDGTFEVGDAEPLLTVEVYDPVIKRSFATIGDDGERHDRREFIVDGS